MSMRSKIAGAVFGALVASVAAPAQTPSFKLDFPKESPISMMMADWGQSRASVRGSAVMLDVHASLSFRNSSQRRIRGVTLLVVAQEMTAGGKMSVAVPSLD